MQTVTTIGLDIAKSVFQVHGVYADGQAVIRRQLKRRFRRSTWIGQKRTKKRKGWRGTTRRRATLRMAAPRKPLKV